MDKKVLANKIESVLKESIGTVDSDILKTALDLSDHFNIKNDNDVYHLVFKATIRSQKIKKVAYPSGLSSAMTDISSEFDLEKWSTLVHAIYDAVSSEQMTYQNALDYYSNMLGKKNHEREKFKKWVQFYNKGEHKKYSQEEENMKKEAFQSGLLTGFYDQQFNPKPPDEIKETVEAERQAFKEQSNKAEEFRTKMKKFKAAKRRVRKLLDLIDDDLDQETATELADLFHAFDRVRIRNVSTAADYAYLYGEKFEKKGFHEGADILLKFAQEEEFQQPDMAPPMPDDAPPAPEAAPETSPEGGVEKGMNPISEALRETSTAAPGEYEQLAGNVSIEEAAKKLEDIASRLSDRRSIRLLAELDIMLDKIGIASMFPELAEAQSKLIDAYTYALVRVTKMLGMLSSGKNLAEIANAKTKEIENKTMKEVNKTFQETGQGPGGQPAERGTEAINEELGGAGASAAPVPEELPEEGQEGQPQPIA